MSEWRDGRFFTSPDGVSARLVDGRDADIVVLGKIAEAIVPTVNKLASERWELFLEAERRSLNNEIRGFEEKRDHLQRRIDEKEREYLAVEA
jgi:hypothetical protein